MRFIQYRVTLHWFYFQKDKPTPKLMAKLFFSVFFFFFFLNSKLGSVFIFKENTYDILKKDKWET